MSSVDNLKAFSRFMLASILTGGKVKRVHFAYSENTQIGSNNKLYIHKLHSLFVSDLKSQSINELFLSSIGIKF